MKNKANLFAILVPIAGCSGIPTEGVGLNEPTGTKQQLVESSAALFPHLLSGPTLVQWSVTDTSSGGVEPRTDYGVKLRTEASGTVWIRLEGCAVDTVKRAFDLMRSKQEDEKQSKWTWSVPCPGSAIPRAARLYVEPIQEGYSYLELPAGAASAPSGTDAGGGAQATYLVIPNRCANLVKHFEITERAASLEPGATDPDWDYLRANTLVPLVCGQQRLPAQTPSMLGVSEFGVWPAKRRAVYLRRTTDAQGDTDVHFHAIDGESVEALWNDAPRLLAKLTEIGARIGATVAMQRVDGVDKLDVEKRAFPIGAEAWDMQTQSAGAAAGTMPMHRRWGARGKLYCLGGAEPSLPSDGGAIASCETDRTELSESRGVDGSRRARLQVRRADGSVAAVALPECVAEGQAPNWKSLLGLGEVKQDTLTWLDSMETAYRSPDPIVPGSSLPCLVPRTCRVTIPAGTDLSRQLLVRPSLSSKSLLSQCSSQCKGSCSEVDLVLAGDVTGGGSGAFTIDKEKLPEGMSVVRISGNASSGSSSVVSIRVAEVAANQPDGTYDGGKALPVITVSGGVDVTVSNVRFVAASGTSGKPRTPAPALARIALDVSSVGAARPTLRLQGVTVEGGSHGDELHLPLYEGLRARGAAVYVHHSDVKAYKRAIGVEDTDFGLVGNAGAPSEIRSGVLSDVSATLYSLNLDGAGRPVSLAGTVKSFPALDLGARTVAFVAQAVVAGPLGVVWGGSDRVSSTGESAVFYEVRIGGGGAADPVSTQLGALGLLINGTGALRLEKPMISKTYMPFECTGANGGSAPLIQAIQQTYSCVGTNQWEMTGASQCAIVQSAYWERDENWPGCALE